MRWPFRREKQPVQLELPFYCGYYNETCGPYVHDGSTGFYGRCRKCAVVYDPVCDR